MKITVCSTHAPGWRRLCKALADLGHRVVFFQRGGAVAEERRDGDQQVAEQRLRLLGAFVQHLVIPLER